MTEFQGVILEMLAYGLVVGGIGVVGWCMKHKQATKAILVACLVIADIVFLLKHFGVI